MKISTAMLYLMARWEVSKAQITEQIASQCSEDLLPAHVLPSAALDYRRDRVLAEIDQEGFIFAAEDCDAQFFNSRQTMVPRRHHRLQIILTGGNVRIRKSVLHQPRPGILGRIREFLNWELYLEAAALLRLRGLAGVPTIRRFDACAGAIEMDYIWGTDLRQILAAGKNPIRNAYIAQQFSFLMAKADEQLTQQITDLVVRVIARGVVPRDIDAANFIKSRTSGRIYMVDFNLIYLRPIPGWQHHAQNVRSVIPTLQQL